MSKIRTLIVLTIVLISISMLAAMPVAAENGNGIAADSEGNIVCEDGEQTPLGSLVANLTLLFIGLAALVAIVGGAGYTLLMSAQPEEGYAKNRKKAVVGGLGTIFMLYGLAEVGRQISPNLDITCILPGL